MNIKKKADNIYIVHILFSIFCIVVGIIIDSDISLVLGAVVAVMGLLVVTHYMTNHITAILKQNNLWTDEVFEKKKITDSKPKMDGFD